MISIPDPRPNGKRRRRNVRKGLTTSRAELSLASGNGQLEESIDDAEKQMIAVQLAAKQRAAANPTSVLLRHHGNRLVLNSESDTQAPGGFLPTPEFVRWVFAGEYARLFYYARRRSSNYWNARRPQWDGSESRSPIWDTISELVRSNALPVVMFIQEQFKDCSRTPIKPDHLLCVSNVDRLLERFQDDLNEVRQQRERYERYWKVQSNPVPDYEYSRLFLYCQTVRNGNETFATSCYDDAINEFFRRADAYKREWNGLLPESFPEEVLREAYGAPFARWRTPPDAT